MSSIADDVRAASSPAEALFVIATALDGLQGRIEKLEGDGVSDDGWGSWPGAVNPGPGKAFERATVDVKGITDRIRFLESAREEAKDPLEIQALQAQIELAKDELTPREPGLDLDQERTLAEDDDGTGVVHVPPVTEEVEAARLKFAQDELKLIDYYGPEDGTKYAVSYAKAGPLLLYYSDREFVMSLTPEQKRAMVNDVEQFSPAEAAEMARDLLKDLDPGTPDIAVGNIIGTT